MEFSKLKVRIKELDTTLVMSVCLQAKSISDWNAPLKHGVLSALIKALQLDISGKAVQLEGLREKIDLELRNHGLELADTVPEAQKNNFTN